MKSTKQTETDEFVDLVKNAISDAHLAASTAAQKYVATATLTKEGLVLDECGGSSVIVYKPSYRLRQTLKALNEIEKGYKGAWYVSRFSINVPKAAGQSYQANDKACNAAMTVLRDRLPNEGEFFTKSFVD